MKRLHMFGLILALIFVLSLSSVTATGFFDNLFAKNNQVTGKVTSDSVEWTDWLNRDVPSGSGDWETTTDFQNVGLLDCEPVAIECVTLAGEAWDSTDDAEYICTTTSGGICKNENQVNTPDNYCEDYKVRFACAKNVTIPYEPAPERSPESVSSECKNPLRFAVTYNAFEGSSITSEAKGDEICREVFGSHWYWAEWHDDGQYANWELNGALLRGEFEEYPWIWIDDQNGECYSTNNQFGLTLRLYERDGGKLNADCHGMNKYHANNFNFQVSDTGLISCNPYEGDTPCDEKRPLLCIQKDGCNGCSDFVNEKACDYADCNWDGRICLDTIEPENLPPKASFTMAENPAIEDEWVYFTSTSTDSDGTITEYDWSIDGIHVSKNQRFGFAFGEVGTHYLTLIVTDDDGASDSSKQSIFIKEAEPDEPNNESEYCLYSTIMIAQDNPYVFDAFNHEYLLELVGGTTGTIPTINIRASYMGQVEVKSLEEDDSKEMLGLELEVKDIDLDNNQLEAELKLHCISAYLEEEEEEDELVCCDAEIAYCLACMAEKTIEEYCEYHPNTDGCELLVDDDDDSICCDAEISYCLACKVGLELDDFCEANPDVLGCDYYTNDDDVDDGDDEDADDGDDEGSDERDDYCVDTDDHGSTSVNYDEQGTVAAANFRIAMTDVCHDTKEDWLIEYYCAGEKGMVTERKCPYGCEDGVCLKNKNDKSDGGSGHSSGNSGTSTTVTPPEETCDGCLTDEACIPYGFRMDNKYCSLAKEFVNYKNKDESCQNNFECDTNLCIDGSCVSKSFLNKLKSLLRKWF